MQDGVTSCLDQLNAVKDKVKLGKGQKVMNRFGLRALSWPFTRPEVEKIVQEIGKIRDSIMLALQVDTVYIIEQRWHY